ncbi:MAG TPA: hypothetical protein VGR16_12075, partial [Thermomicrobiales bacterium]|nr:hypothetical protein [Thermomicrobiales bacterium]
MSSALAVPPAATVVDRLEGLLGELVSALVPTTGAAGRNRGRPPILPATLLWTGLAVCVLRRATSQLDLWRLLTGAGLWHFPAVPVSDDAIYKRLAREGATALARLFTDLTALLVDRLDAHADRTLAPFAAEVYALDETTLDPVARTLPVLRGVPPGDDRLLPGKLAGVCAGRRQLWQAIECLPNPHQNEKVAARTVVADLPERCLLVFDLGYFAFAWCDDLTDTGRWWVSRLRDKTSHEPIHIFYQDDETLDA